MAKERLVLASQSPRRRELLKEAGLVFEVIEPDAGAECGICSRETPPEMAARLG
ncbi:MAG: Maf family protein, partial [Pirellulaceae bacterium]